MGTNVITDAKVGQWDTAYGWGNHASGGYQTVSGLNAAIDSHLNQSNPTSGYVLSWNGSDYAWVSNAGYSNSDVDTHLNTGSASNNEVLSWNGSDYAWVAQSGGGASAINDLSDVTISSVSSGQVLKYNGSAWVNAADSGGPADTDALSEGSSNLYFTNARADARIGAADLADLSNVHTAAPTDGQVLTWDNSNTRWAPATPSGGSGSTVVERFKINYATNGQLSSITDKTSGISSVSIDSASGGDITINTTGYSYPPAGIIYYGYQYASNKYNVVNMNKDVTLREVPGGGSSGSPTAFGSFSSIKVKAAEGDTGAGRSFGTVTHAWVQLVMGG